MAHQGVHGIATFIPNPQASWIKSNKIFGYIYSPNSHQQLLENSTDFLRVYMREGLLTFEDLDTILAGTVNVVLANKLAIYKILGDVKSTPGFTCE
jgi:hypothetical protein